MAWQLKLFGETFRELDCSPSFAEQVEKETGYRWFSLESLLIGEHVEARAIRRTAAALLSLKLGLSNEDALAKLDTLTMTELSAACTEYEDDLPTVLEDGFPQSADETSTPI